MGLSEMRGGMTMVRTVYLKMRIIRCCEARTPDLLIVDKRENNCQILDVAILEDGRVRDKEDEKTEKFQDLAKEIRKMWEGQR